MNIRTDLALESAEFDRKIEGGVQIHRQNEDEITVTRIEIENEEAAKRLQKPRGRYVTLEVPRFTASAGTDRQAVSLLAREILRLLPSGIGSVLVAGLGNTEITPDALGPRVADRIIATRHISSQMKKELGLGELLPVSVLAPGVLGQTGIETGEILLGTVERIHPSAVIVVDALAARSLSRLGSTVQLSNTGICPGSGVGNSRMEISRDTLGCPVISVGVPTVVDIKTLFYDVGGGEPPEIEMIVTPREVDTMIERAAELVAVSINCALQTSLSLDDILGLI